MDSLFNDWGLWYLFLQWAAVAATAFIPPLPAEVMVIASGAMAAEGTMSLGVAFTVTFLGCQVGDLLLYLSVRYRLVRILHRWKWGRGLHRGLLRLSLRAGKVNTWVGLLLLRWVPGGRTACMVSAALMKQSWGTCLWITTIGSVIWTAWLVGLGYITGTTTGLPPWVSTLIGLGVGTLVGLGIAVLWSRRRQGSTQVRLTG